MGPRRPWVSEASPPSSGGDTAHSETKGELSPIGHASLEAQESRRGGASLWSPATASSPCQTLWPTHGEARYTCLSSHRTLPQGGEGWSLKWSVLKGRILLEAICIFYSDSRVSKSGGASPSQGSVVPPRCMYELLTCMCVCVGWVRVCVCIFMHGGYVCIRVCM